MARSLTARLDRIAARQVPRRSPAPVYDFSALSPREVGDLDALLAAHEGDRQADGTLALSMLTDDELDFLIAIEERITEAR